MINVIYAYEPEVKALKKFIEKNNLQPKVKFFKLPVLLKSAKGLLLNVGFAGSLGSDLELGQVVLIKKVIHESCESPYIFSGPDYFLAEKYSFNHGLSPVSLLTVKKPVTDPNLRDELRRKTNADVVDMEGHSLYKSCMVVNNNNNNNNNSGNSQSGFAKKQDSPLVVFKVVTDNADSNTPESVMQKKYQWGSILGRKVFEFLNFYLDYYKLPDND